MTREEREATRQRFGFACGYCGVSETSSGAALTIDHFRPVSRGGSDEASNWVACYHACNEFKGAYWSAHSEQPHLLQPGRGDENEHLRVLSSGALEALTARGDFHLERLHLNRPELIAHRVAAQAVEALQVERNQLFVELRAISKEMRELRERIER